MTPETFDRLDPTTELERLLEQAETRVDQLTDLLKAERADHALRSDALNRTGESNDGMRATLARIEKLVAPQWRPLAYDRNALIDDIRAILADQETK